MIRAGIIDSGVHNPEAGYIAGLCSFPLQDNAVLPVSGQATDTLGHGTHIAEIMAEHNPQLSLYAARVFFDRLVSTPAQIAAALDWLVQLGVQLVNMSFGLTTDRSILRQACSKAVAAGVILVAAAPARGDPVFPAAYPGVIRACGDARCRPGEISWLNNRQADFGGHVRSDDHALAGASIGCARVSAALVSILAEVPARSRDEIILRLQGRADYTGAESIPGLP
jgi:subtilisin family serine protease